MIEEQSNTPRYKRVAFCGWARSGKDEAGRALIAKGYQRVCFGDLIKADLNALIKQHFGFSAFTQVDAEKKLIRPILEIWGDVNYNGIMNRFFADLPELAVNTRLVREREAKKWIESGGVLVWLTRPGNEPATEWEKQAADNLLFNIGPQNFVYIANDGTVEELHAEILKFVGIEN